MNLEVDNIVNIILEKNAKVVGLQFPEGLKRYGPKVAMEIEKRTTAAVLISGDPCYGACDVDLTTEVELLFHFGHSEIPALDTRGVHFIEVRSDANVIPAVRQALTLLRGKKVGLVTTVQHVHALQQVCRELKANNFECLVGTGDNRVKYPGQVLGCNFSAARSLDVDEYLFVGNGNFHPLGVALATKKRVVIADPYLVEARMPDSDTILKQRYAAVSRAMRARTFCIIVGTKMGQHRLDRANQLKNEAQQSGYDAYIITSNEITPSVLRQFPADAYVNTACPRIAIDEIGRFAAPMLTPVEFEMVLGRRDLANYEFDEFANL